MNENDNTANAVNGSGAFDVEGNPLDAGRLWPIDQAALISGVTTRALRYCDETGLVKTARTRAAQNQTATVMNAMPLSGSFGAIRSALVGDPRFADPCGEALYGRMRAPSSRSSIRTTPLTRTTSTKPRTSTHGKSPNGSRRNRMYGISRNDRASGSDCATNPATTSPA